MAKYIEPVTQLINPEKHTWVEDKGDFYIVRVPMYKTFSRESLDKPTIFLMDQFSTVTQVSVNGYANFKTEGSSSLTDCEFDTSNMRTVEDRPAVLFYSKHTENIISGMCITGKRNGPMPKIDYPHGDFVFSFR